MRLIFMGTPDFACSALKAIVEAGHEVVLAVTQPDKPKGRGKGLSMPPVKELALSYQIPVFQPVKVKTAESVEYLKQYNADAFIVAAFGQILSKEILDMPRLGCINIHASLLPKYRGSAPIQWAIIDGENKSGVTIMQMDEGIDTGDIMGCKEVPITNEDTGDSLHDKLAKAGAELICETLKRLEQGEVERVRQRDEESVYAKRLDKEMGHINWKQDAVSLDRLIRGLNSWPGSYTGYQGKKLKIIEESVVHEPADGVPGSVSMVSKSEVVVNTGKEKMKLLCVQPEGKKKMAISDFLRGYPVDKETIFG